MLLARHNGSDMRHRWLAVEAAVNLDAVRPRTLSEAALERCSDALAHFASAPMFVDDRRDLRWPISGRQGSGWPES